MASAETRQPVAFWLIPALDDHRRLTAAITELAGRHAAPVFEPHVTLHVDTADPRIDIAGELARIASTLTPIRLVAGDTGHSAAYYQTLYIGFEPDRQADAAAWSTLSTLQRALAAALDPAEARIAAALSAYPLRPHLSLLYARLAEAERAALARAARFTGQTLTFDTVAAVRPAPGFTDLAEVDRWAVFGHRRLGSQA